MEVRWEWTNKSEGTIRWTFTNNSGEKQSAILLRGARRGSRIIEQQYYFGNAFWAVYLTEGWVEWERYDLPLALPVFNPRLYGTAYDVERYETRPPSLGIVEIDGQYLVALVFTLLPGTSWSMIEHGYTNGAEPYNVKLVPVTYQGDHCFRVRYDPEEIQSFNQMYGTSIQGYQPNPSTVKVSTYKGQGPYIEMFNDQIEKTECPEPWWEEILKLLGL